MTIEWRVTYGKLQSTYRREKEKQMRELEVPGSWFWIVEKFPNQVREILKTGIYAIQNGIPVFL